MTDSGSNAGWYIITVIIIMMMMMMMMSVFLEHLSM